MKIKLLIILFLINSSCSSLDDETCIFQVENESLFLKSIYWGINGNNRLVTISLNKEKLVPYKQDEKKDFCFVGYFPIYFKTLKDTLYIYTYKKSSIPESFDSKIIVKQIEIGNKENLKLMKDTNYLSIENICKTK